MRKRLLILCILTGLAVSGCGKTAQISKSISVAEKSYRSGSEYVGYLKDDLCAHYQDATGHTAKDKCLIVADESYRSPNFNRVENREPLENVNMSGYTYVITLNDPEMLVTSEGSTSIVNFAECIFELGHEFTHYMCTEISGGEGEVSWIEETICEAMALYYLDYYAQHWKETTLPEKVTKNTDDLYMLLISSELDHEINKDNEEAGSADYSLSDADPETLLYINDNAEEHREYRCNEMHKLSKKIQPACIAGLIEYSKYTDTETCLLRTDEYRAAFPDNAAVAYLCDISDEIAARPASE
ncbi:MAG: hypothetical protein K5695_18315 [Oscillospiraceae bacterium]|nr:hypothetical protein [Oscillospiraceae bacterium]